MIISKTPMRISFIGGGSDLPSFYNDEAGLIVAGALDKHVYVSVLEKFDDDVRLSYSETENVQNVANLRHDIARETLLDFGIYNKIEISSNSEIPSAGSGLGSSSSYAVGLITALNLHVHKMQKKPHEVAEKACEIEINILKKPIGKQDQYMAAFGGLKAIQFNPDGTVNVKFLTTSYESIKKLESRLVLMYTGVTRKADAILRHQSELIKKNPNTKLQIRDMVQLAKELEKDLNENNIDTLGELLDEAWNIKKTITHQISNDVIDNFYNVGKHCGAVGGKLLGAGGGGFILFYADEDSQKKIMKAFPDHIFSPVRFDTFGTKIIYDGNAEKTNF
jgi:D-glycero-alpha-D-manno-heptose-7-phosphate kinase